MEVFTKITLINAVDEENAQNGLIAASAVKLGEFRARVDTGSWPFVINEATRKALGLRIVRDASVKLADNVKREAQIASPVRVVWQDDDIKCPPPGFRDCTCNPYVLPDEAEILLGVCALENLDLDVLPKIGKLAPAHEFDARCIIK